MLNTSCDSVLQDKKEPEREGIFKHHLFETLINSINIDHNTAVHVKILYSIKRLLYCNRMQQ